MSGEVQCQGADAVPGELPGQQLGGGAVLAAAEAVGDEADHGLAALDGVPAGDVISVESGEKFLCHKRSFQRARAPFSAALPKADLKIPQQNDQAGNRRSNWQLQLSFQGILIPFVSGFDTLLLLKAFFQCSVKI